MGGWAIDLINTLSFHPTSSFRQSSPESFLVVRGFTLIPKIDTIEFMKRKPKRTLTLIFSRPTPGNIRWEDILSLFRELGAEISEREGSRVGVRLFGDRRVFHRPHPSPDTDKGAVENIRKWLETNGVTP
jgi:hypothetical protein